MKYSILDGHRGAAEDQRFRLGPDLHGAGRETPAIGDEYSLRTGELIVVGEEAVIEREIERVKIRECSV